MGIAEAGDPHAPELTLEDQELIEFARYIIVTNRRGEEGIHTMGVTVPGADGKMFMRLAALPSPRVRMRELLEF
jgi:hypothetical protein